MLGDVPINMVFGQSRLENFSDEIEPRSTASLGRGRQPMSSAASSVVSSPWTYPIFDEFCS
jgi:hypothetical protein